jgi:uncharacterized protein (TIGR02996 family)
MNQEERFLHGIWADPKDLLLRQVYADWLDDQNDSRAEYLRLDVKLAELPANDAGAFALRQRLVAMHPMMPPKWLRALCDYRVSVKNVLVYDSKEASDFLGRPAQFIDAEGYECVLKEHAIHPLQKRIAYLECRSQWLGTYQDITFTLHLQGDDNKEATWQPYTYNPYFGCDLYFIAWFGEVVILVYQEKHSFYLARFARGMDAKYHRISWRWIVDGRRFGYLNHGESEIRVLSLPELTPLPAPTDEEAQEWASIWDS